MGSSSKVLLHSIMKSIFVLAFFFVTFSLAERCQHPPPAPNYKNSLYEGRWYEMGRIQTPGGAAFQEGNVCTIVTYAPNDPDVGGGDIGYSSKKETPEGRFVNADYCIHIISRQPTLSQEKVDELIAFSEGLGLNTENIDYKISPQEGCW